MLGAALLTACSGVPKAPTLAELVEGEAFAPEPAVELPATREKAIDAYRAFLADAPEESPLRAEAIRRLADLGLEDLDELEAGDEISRKKTAAVTRQRKAIIDLYTTLIERYPDNPRNAEALYQLSRAYESVGQRDKALAALDRLVGEHPDTARMDEVQFRRGETLYVDRRYREAEEAYRAVIRIGEQSPFYDQSLYKGGWSLFKQQRWEDALDFFMALLDRRVKGNDIPLEGMSRVERERIDDTLRVSALSFSYLGGAGAISRYFGSRGGRPYEYLVYRTLGEQYLNQERYTDAATTFQAFADQRPLHREAPRLQLKVIETYQRAGFADHILAAKREFVARYGMDQPYWGRFKRSDAPDVVGQVKAQVDELSRYYHAQAQQTKTKAAYQEAIRWYRKRLAYFPGEADSADSNFLLAELLFETQQYAEATLEYEKTAYHYPQHKRSAEAGYAALLSYAAQEKRLSGSARLQWQKRGLESGSRFAERFPNHPQAPSVLARLAQQYFALGDSTRASDAARRLVERYPSAPAELRRSSWLVIAHSAFDQQQYAKAEQGYLQALGLTGSRSKERAALIDRLGASVYKQAESKRDRGDFEGAAATFLRVAQVAPESSIRATADFDAAAALLSAKRWKRATEVLEEFRRRHPKHPLQAQVTEKLAVAYLESGDKVRAAEEFGRIAATGSDINLRREAAWRSAELYEEAKLLPQAITAWEGYVRSHPTPVSEAIEARYRLLLIHQKRGDTKRVRAAHRAIVEADRRAGRARTDRTRYLAAHSRYALARDSIRLFQAIELKEPLQRSLKRKQAAMKRALADLGAVAEYGVADVVTAATYQTADIYRQLAEALMKSQRPRNLDEEGLEEYELLLEEQAFPFEQKAIEVHAINTRRTLEGIYDEWVRKSYQQLARLMPARYAKEERSADAYSTLD
ncbi:MAG: tetratricopeptide repeat protein [Gammaproteobacteria bacterium]